MINFIICDDEEKYLDFMHTTITKYMMKNDMEYNIHTFNDYNQSFMKIVESKLPFKVYILDIETPTRSGFDVARIIRYKDVDSIIIFLTGHQELSHIAVENEFLFLAFINKFVDCENRLIKALDQALRFLKVRKTIKFKDNGIIYTIALDDILYITKDSVTRKCILKTDYSEFHLSKNLNQIMKMLTDNFIQTHRACIVNKNRVVNYSKSKKIITFDTGETIDIISSKFEGKLI